MEASYFLRPHPPVLPKSSASFPLTFSSYQTNCFVTGSRYPQFCSFQSSSLSFNNNSLLPRQNALCSTVLCRAAFNGFALPEPRDMKLGIKVGATVVWACVLGMLMCSKNAMAVPTVSPSEMTVNKMSGSTSSLSTGERDEKNQHLDISKIKSQVNDIRCEKLGTAVEHLTSVYEDNKEINAQEAYLIDMLLVEMLIRQGKYKEALNRECLKSLEDPEDVLPSDTRIIYKAYLYWMLKDYDKAKIWCQAILE